MRPPSMPLLSAVVAGLLAQPAAGFTPAYAPVALRRPTSSPLCYGEQSARLRRRPQLGMMTTRIPEGDGVSRRRRRRDRTKRSVAEPSTFVGSDPIISASSVEGNYLENVLEEKQAAATRVVVEEPQAATTDEASGWVEDSAELLSKGGRAVGAGAKSVALASTPLRREADGRLAVDGQGLLNLCILVFSGLWVIHSIVTVDAESWRGWTFQEIVMRIPWDNWDSYEYGLSAHPILTKTAINGGIYVIGDWLSQVNWGREEDHPLWEFDLQRTLRNGLIGAFFGPVSHFYYDFSDWILPPVGMNRPFKIMMDQSIYFCTKCTTYITLVSLLRGDSLEQTREALDTRLVKVITTGWRFWPFVHIFTYFLIPPRHRVLWVNCVDLLWSSILAGMTSGKKLDDIDADADGQEGDEASQQLAFEASDIDKTAVDA